MHVTWLLDDCQIPHLIGFLCTMCGGGVLMGDCEICGIWGLEAWNRDIINC